ncbi:hypothetical protein AB0F91_29580 [Amycolatopsis sp. NPDC023774]|uniref:hypothetical protein n=1 Tax=Amycolatopsis sp. NPDC023774 TaxID=3155015 RepID=UPI0033FAB49D
MVKVGLDDSRFSPHETHSSGGYRGLAVAPALDKSPLNADAPVHACLRRLRGRAFTPRHVKSSC